jgi:hypothetical protein
MRLFSTLALCSGLFAASLAQATTVHVNDNYLGNLPTHNYAQTDRIGSSLFEISSTDFNFIGNLLTVTINTNYNAAANGTYGTTWGDLFLDTPGGKTWDYVVDTSSSQVLGGNFKTYKSNDLNPSNYIFRNDEIVQYKKDGSVAESAMVDLSHAGSSISYTFNYANLGLHTGDLLGFRWAETCGNDVIQGSIHVPAQPVPEPETFAMLGLGLAAIAVARRRRA